MEGIAAAESGEAEGPTEVGAGLKEGEGTEEDQQAEEESAEGSSESEGQEEQQLPEEQIKEDIAAAQEGEELDPSRFPGSTFYSADWKQEELPREEEETPKVRPKSLLARLMPSLKPLTPPERLRQDYRTKELFRSDIQPAEGRSHTPSTTTGGGMFSGVPSTGRWAHKGMAVSRPETAHIALTTPSQPASALGSRPVSRPSGMRERQRGEDGTVLTGKGPTDVVQSQKWDSSWQRAADIGRGPRTAMDTGTARLLLPSELSVGQRWIAKRHAQVDEAIRREEFSAFMSDYASRQRRLEEAINRRIEAKRYGATLQQRAYMMPPDAHLDVHEDMAAQQRYLQLRKDEDERQGRQQRSQEDQPGESSLLSRTASRLPSAAVSRRNTVMPQAEEADETANEFDEMLLSRPPLLNLVGSTQLAAPTEVDLSPSAAQSPEAADATAIDEASRPGVSIKPGEDVQQHELMLKRHLYQHLMAIPGYEQDGSPLSPPSLTSPSLAPYPPRQHIDKRHDPCAVLAAPCTLWSAKHHLTKKEDQGSGGGLSLDAIRRRQLWEVETAKQMMAKMGTMVDSAVIDKGLVMPLHQLKRGVAPHTTVPRLLINPLYETKEGEGRQGQKEKGRRQEKEKVINDRTDRPDCAFE